MPSQQQLNPNNFGVVPYGGPSEPCEGPRFIHVPLTYASSEFDSNGFRSDVIDLSAFTQGMPAQKLSCIQGLVVRNPCAPSVSGPFSAVVVQFDIQFNNGFKLFVPNNVDGDQANSYGGTYYIPVLATSPTQVIINAWVGTATFDPVTVDFYFTNQPIQPGMIPGIFVEIV